MSVLQRFFLTRKGLLLVIIFFIAVCLRFYKLGDIPAALHRDEAFLGYNALSLLETGRDMTGNFLPLHISSFLYSPAGYSYASIPFISLFGLNAFSVRFASALFGSVTVLITYLFVKKLISGKVRERIALIAAFLLAINPWHINLSRTATENVIVVFLITLGTYLFLSFIDKKLKLYLFFSLLCFFLSLFCYQAPRAFLPLFLPLLWFIFSRGEVKKNQLMAGSLYFAFFLIPITMFLLSPNLSLRLRTVSIFATHETKARILELIPQDALSNSPSMETRFFHNKFLGYGLQGTQNYFKHFSYDFLFTEAGFPDRYRVPLMGLLYIVELPFFILGVWFFIRDQRKAGVLLLGWILLAPLGSALTFDDVPNLQRTLIMQPAIAIVVSYGFIASRLFTKSFIWRSVIFLACVPLLLQVLFYLHQYYIHVNYYRPWYRQDGYKMLVSEVNKLKNGNKKVLITNRESAPTIFFLFYNNYDPSLFQKVAMTSQLRDFDRVGFDKYKFSEEECPWPVQKVKIDDIRKDTLYVNSGLCKIPDDARVHEVIKRKDGSTVFYMLSLRN